MTATKDIETILAQQEFPIELLRPVSSHVEEGGDAASMVSGVVAARQPEEAICPFMRRRNLLIPHEGQVTRSLLRVV